MRAAFLVIALFPFVCARGADTLPVYVLSIGSGDYVRADDDKYFSFGSNDAAYLGARRVAQIFASNGARRVIQLLGRDGDRVSRNDMLGAVEELARLADQDGAMNPLLIVYVSAHGLSESFGYNLFVIPGDLVIRENMLDRSGPMTQLSNIEGLNSAAPTALEFSEAMDHTGMEFLLFIDTCFETREERNLEAIRSVDAQVARLSGDVSNVLHFLNLPRGPHPVVFSAPPGSLAWPAQDPLSEDKAFIAPLARRLVLAARVAENTGRLERGKLLDFLTTEAADPETAPGVTWFEGAPDPRTVLRHGKSGATFEKRRGSSHATRTCCDDAAVGSRSDGEGAGRSAASSNSQAMSTTGLVGGAAVKGRIDTSAQTVWSLDPNSFEVDFQLHARQVISISLSAPAIHSKSGTMEGPRAPLSPNPVNRDSRLRSTAIAATISMVGSALTIQLILKKRTQTPAF